MKLIMMKNTYGIKIWILKSQRFLATEWLDHAGLQNRKATAWLNICEISVTKPWVLIFLFL